MLSWGTWECADCGRALRPGDRLCPNCGSTRARRRYIPSGRRFNWAYAIVALLVLGAVAFLVTSRFAHRPSSTGEVIRHFRRGQELLEAGRHEEAIAEFETVTRMAPESVAGHHELARACDVAGRHADAVRALRHTLRATLTDKTITNTTRNSEEAELRCELAMLLAKADAFPEAMAEIEKASRRDPSIERTPDYQIALAIVQAGRGRLEAGRRALRRAMELSPKATRDAVERWIADRPNGPEVPLLRSILAEGNMPRGAASDVGPSAAPIDEG